MADRKRMKNAVDFEVLIDVLKSMSEAEFEDYICELEDLYQSVHPEIKEKENG